jgi:hypothetical protein
MSTLKVTFKDDAKRIQTPWAAKRHVAELDARNIGLYTLDQLQAGEEFRKMVDAAYRDSQVYLNYRSKFIAVKVDAARFTDKASEAAEIIDRLCSERGYDKMIKGSNIIFHLPI